MPADSQILLLIFQKNKNKIMFIVLEGLDGSGITTQSMLLEKNISSMLMPTVLTKEPTSSTVGKLIRKHLKRPQKEIDNKGLQLLFAADRQMHIKSFIEPNLKERNIVISDRYFFSSIAFGARNNDEFKWLSNLYKDCLQPDIVFLFKMPPKVCIKRIHKRGESQELFETEDKLRMVWKNYKKLARKYNYFYILDGDRSIESVGQEIYEKMLELL